MAARGPRALSSTDNTKTASRRISGEAAQASLLEAARELFYQEGVRAVGVEAVVERAGVNKMSLYRQFKSKDDLVLAYLARSAENFWGYFNASMDAHPDDARAAAAVLHRPVGAGEPGGLPGCPFVNVAAEFRDPSHPARQFVERNKSQLLARLRERAAPPAPSIRTRSPTIWPS